MLLLCGTRKGLFLLHGDEDRAAWKLEGPLLTGWSVYHAIRDRRDGSLQVAANNFVYGGTFQRSADEGKTWERAEGLGLPEESGLKLEETWHVEPGRDDGEIWLGATPGILFRSADGGESFEPVQSMLDHPTREKWEPGAGGMCCHSIQLDPSDPNRMYIAISAAGTFRTDDGTESWSPANKGVAADFFPEPDNFPEVGQCVHKLLLHPERPDRLWQQNHCGVYRSDDRGETWERLEGNGLPSGFGFPLALDPRDPDVAYVIPEVGAENRVTLGREARRLPDRRRRRELGAGLERPPRARLGGGDARGLHVRRARAVRRLLRDAERLGVRVDRRRRELDGDRAPASARALGRSGVVLVRLPSLLAAQAGGQSQFEVEAATARACAAPAARCGSPPRRERRASPARERVRGRQGRPASWKD